MSPNPQDQPDYFTDIVIGGRKVPGLIQDIRGLENKENIVVQMGVGVGGASTIWRGRPPIEGIEIEIILPTDTPEAKRASYAAFDDFIKFLKPNPSTKPPSYTVTNASFGNVFVKQVWYKGHTAPVYRVNDPCKAIIKVDEFRKAKPIAIGPPEPAIIDPTNPSPKDTQEASLGFWTGVSSSPVPPQ